MTPSSLKAPQEPGEFVVVPKRFTAKMIDAGQAALDCVPINRCVQQASQVYRAMIAASPCAGTMVAVPRAKIEEWARWFDDDGNSAAAAELRALLRGGAAGEGKDTER